MRRVVLASQSPRRRELLKESGITFVAKTKVIEEIINPNISIEDAICVIALEKAKAVQEEYPKDIIIGADTMVCYKNEVLGKPKDRTDAYRMLKMLSGQTHRVITGVAIIEENHHEVFYAETEVSFYPLTDEDIYTYIDTKEPLDKAGAYGIQGFGKFLIAKINGDYYNVVGLPIAMLYRKLKDWK